METKEIGFTRQYETAVAVIEQAKTLVVKTAQDFEVAKDKLSSIRDIEKDLEAQYKQHPVIIEAKRLQGIKGDLAEMLENARKGLKNGPMLRYEQAMEAERQAKERKLQAEAKAKADAEFARQQAERRAEFERQQAEKVRLEAERKKFYEQGQKAKALEAEQAAKAAAAAAEQTRQDAIAAKQEQAQAVVPTVVVEKTAPTVSRTKRYQWQITTKGGQKFKKEDFKKTIRLGMTDLPGTEAKFFTLDDTRISGVVDSLGENHGIANVEVWTVLV